MTRRFRALARRMADIAPFHVMALLARAKELEAAGHTIVHMEIGEPDFPTAAPIVAAGQQTLAEGRTRYTPAAGLPELRQAISAHYREQGVEIPASRILVTPGASGALQLATAILVNPGDRVLLADPGYPCNRHFVRLVDGRAVGIPVGPETGYQLTAELIEQYWDERTAAVLLASPANPTGTVIAPDVLAAIISTVEGYGGRVIMDEIYHGLVYGGVPLRTALAYSNRVLVVNSFSKYYGMTGWRLGWLVAPDDCVGDAEKLAQNLFLAASTPAQYAALAAFTPETRAIFEERRREFQARRDFLLPALRELGFDIPVAPDGAFYLYADCSRFTDDSYDFTLRLLEQTGVAITPGIDFGNHLPQRHVRFAYTNAIPVLAEGVERLRRALLR